MVSSHKAGPLKQPKKQHKHGKHRSKGTLAVKGKVQKISLSRKNAQSLSKKNRRNQENQIRKAKLSVTAEEKKNLGAPGQPPVCIALLPVNDGVNIDPIVELFKSQGAIFSTNQNSFYFYCKKLKKRFQVIYPGKDADLFEQLDLLKCCDIALLIWDNSFSIDPLLKTCLLAQGVGSVQHLVAAHAVSSQKEKIERRKHMTETLDSQSFVAKDAKVHYLDTSTDIDTVLWSLVNTRHPTLSFLSHRSYIYSSSVDWSEGDSETGILKVTGYVRGGTLDANQLVHIPGFGHFRIEKITTAREPFSDPSTQFVEEVVSVSDDTAPTLDMECVVDEMEGEQTWPTEEEMMQAEQTRRLPAGTSSYQATWMLSDDEDAISDDEDAMSDAMSGSDDCKSQLTVMSDDEEEDGEDADYDVHFDEETEAAELKKLRDAQDHEAFPDEIDTPMHIAARVRFQKFRGLKSFRTSPWDPKENLPTDYARISQIPQFRGARRRLATEGSDRCVTRGRHVTIHVQGVPASIRESKVSGLALFTLLPHEQRMCVQHSLLHRHPLSNVVVKGKEQILAQVGFRRYVVQPIYSDHSKANKHKMERFIPEKGSFVASYYAPITLSDSPAVFFKMEENGTVSLIATGSLLSCNPDRVICKRVILSGHPLKINKKSATIRYLFFNRDDIAYFKPIELRTKDGRRGHIKEALGTHGHCKISFDKPIKQSDTILLNLYKRVFPKWFFQYS